MYIFVIPTYNRSSKLDQLIECIRNSELSQSINVVILDSSDSKKDIHKNLELANRLSNIDLIKLPSNLLWTGQVHFFLKNIFPKIDPSKIIGLLNDDVILDDKFFTYLKSHTKIFESKIVSCYCQITSDKSTIEIRSQVVQIMPRKLDVQIYKSCLNNLRHDKKIILSATGRGIFFPASLNAKAGFRYLTFIPHYLGDLIFVLILIRRGLQLHNDLEFYVTTDNSFGNTEYAPFSLKSLFTRKSPRYLVSQIFFWIFIFEHKLRLTLPVQSVSKKFK